MITIANRIQVNPDYAEAFEERFRDRVGFIDGTPGFISNQVLRPAKSDDPYIVLTYWETKEAFEAWTKSDSFRQGHAKSERLPEEAIMGSKLEIHEVFLDSKTGE